MQINHKFNQSGDLVISINGDMDAKGCETLKPTLEDILQNQEVKDVEMDMKQVEFLDSSGVGAIVFLFKRLRQAGSELNISGVNGQPKDILKLLRIDKAINVTTV